MKLSKLLLVIIVVGLFTLPMVFAQFPIPTIRSVAFTPQTQFVSREENSSVSFADNGDYTNATLDKGIWDFTGFYLNSSNATLPAPMGAVFSIGAQNCNITITRFDPLNVFPPQGTGSVEYTVSGRGNQTLNIHYGVDNVDERWIGYNVTIDGNIRAQGDGWNLLSGGWLSISGATSSVEVSYGMHPPTVFSSGRQFDFPALNSSISFAVDGTYVFGDSNGSVLKLQNLALNGTVASSHYAYWGLGVSALNSNVTITSWVSNTEDNKEWINYTVSGEGDQTLNLNYDKNSDVNYTVYVDGVLQPQNTTWSVSNDDWLTVTGATSSVSITGIQNVPDWIKNLPPPGTTLAGNDFVIYTAILMGLSNRRRRDIVGFQTNNESVCKMIERIHQSCGQH